jgi:hypothetical protein
MEKAIINLQKFSENGHTVVLEGINNWSCNCKGFAFNNECSHIKKQQDKQIFFKEKEQLKKDIESRIKEFMFAYQIIPVIKVNKAGQVSIKFIF